MFVVKAKTDFAAKRVEYLYEAMQKDKKCDTGFSVRGRNFPAHLIILMACSEFFGTNEGLVEDIMSPFDYEVIEAILKYCYTGEINIGDKHRTKLLELANLLEVKIPPQFKTVNNSNCLKVLKSSGDSELLKKAKDLTMENFETLHKTQDFLNLPASNVIEILKWDDLFVRSEESVFNAVKLWVNHDDANRKKELAQLMTSVRLSLLSMEFLVDEVMTFCHSCAECMTTIRQTIKNKNDKSFIPRETPRRKIKGKKMAVVGGLDFEDANTIDIFDGLENNWTLSKNIGINKCRFASVVVEDWIVIIGGKNSSKESVEYIDLKSGQKQPLKPLNQARHDFSAVTLSCGLSTDVYVIGGFKVTNIEKKTGSILSSVERWSSNTGDWEIIAPLLVGVDSHSASVIADKIYITGGRISYSKSTNKVQMYSVETNSWTCRAQMIQERHSHSSVAFKGKLYVAGGYLVQTSTILDSVEHFDPNANVWNAFTKLPKPAYGISLCCFQNKLFSMGGCDKYDYFSDVWEYDETSKSWKASTSLSRKRTRAVAHVIPYDSII
ncbi:kelch-like protein 25 isoform X2 [Arctopsyche grandis]|uniref:kelch-like protein 25 isoform X2 n=1 Tax=Arctopsyche grandis TaxID=121162 RepID=UPI00406D9936